MKSKSQRMVRRNHARYHQGRDDLNIVPMIDMMVILVFFLIFTAVFSKTNILQLNLPASASAPGASPSLNVGRDSTRATPGTTLRYASASGTM